MYRQYSKKISQRDRFIKKAIHNSICCKHSYELEKRLLSARKQVRKLSKELSGLYMKLDSLELLGKQEEQLKCDVRILQQRKQRLRNE